MIVRASILILARQLVVQATMVVCGVWMARNCTPAEFGVYALCNFLVPLLGVGSDLGLGAWISRASREPDRAELETAFTVRQSVDLTAIVVYLALVPLLARWYGLPSGATASLRLLAAAPLFNSLAQIPMVRLERALRFHVIASIEIVQILAFGSVTLYGFARGWGPIAAIYGWLTHAIVGAALYQLALPWRPGWRLDRDFLRTALPFSAPFQTTAAVMTFRDGALPLLVAALLGSAAVGELNWAQMLALSIASGAFVAQRALLPALSRHLAAGSRPALRRDAELALRGIMACVLSASLPILLFARPLCRFVFGEQWLASLPLFYALWPINLIIPFVVVMMAVHNALGSSRTVLRAYVWSACLLWLLSAVLLPAAGTAGFPAALYAAQLALLRLAPFARNEISWHPLRAVLPQLAAAASISAAGAALGLSALPVSAVSLVVTMALTALVLLAVCSLVSFRHLLRPAMLAAAAMPPESDPLGRDPEAR